MGGTFSQMETQSISISKVAFEMGYLLSRSELIRAGKFASAEYFKSMKHAHPSTSKRLMDRSKTSVPTQKRTGIFLWTPITRVVDERA